MRQYVPWEKLPNTVDEKPNNSLSIIDRLAENGLQHISRLLDESYHLRSREERQTKNILINLPIPRTLITSHKNSPCKEQRIGFTMNAPRESYI